MFKRSGKGAMKPFPANECSNFPPEDKRGYRRKSTATGEAATAESNAEAAAEAAQKQAGRKVMAKTAAKSHCARSCKEACREEGSGSRGPEAGCGRQDSSRKTLPF